MCMTVLLNSNNCYWVNKKYKVRVILRILQLSSLFFGLYSTKFLFVIFIIYFYHYGRVLCNLIDKNKLVKYTLPNFYFLNIY